MLQAHTHIKCSYGERANLTLQKMIYAFMTSTGQFRYLDALPGILESYNNRPHAAFNGELTPMMAEEKESWIKVRSFNMNKVGKVLLQQQRRKGREEPLLSVGDAVRVRKKKTRFERGYHPFSSIEIYEIAAINDRHFVPTYKIKPYESLAPPLKKTVYRRDLAPVNLTRYNIEEVLGERLLQQQQQVQVRVEGLDRPIWVAKINVRQEDESQTT